LAEINLLWQQAEILDPEQLRRWRTIHPQSR
jgi:hypothetical protein